jgi:hypothetical protein
MVILNLMGGDTDDNIFSPDTKWWNKDGLLYTINNDATKIIFHQSPNIGIYDIGDVTP